VDYSFQSLKAPKFALTHDFGSFLVTMEDHLGVRPTESTPATPSPMRLSTSETELHSLNDDLAVVATADPFTKPNSSRPTSPLVTSYASGGQPHTYFRSRRVQKGGADQPWKQISDPNEKWVTIVPLLGLALGFAIAGFLTFDGIKSVVHHNYCPVLDENFSRGWNKEIWTKEAEVGGFGYEFYSFLLS
jgi:hypothetical protein